ncbi:MAG TPA: hypothetical protein VF939_03310 [Puia sp.]
MKKFLLYLSLLAIPIIVLAFKASREEAKDKAPLSKEGIQFIESSWTAAIERAKKENKPPWRKSSP